MSDVVISAMVTGAVAVLVTVINKWGDKKDIKCAINRIAEGLHIGLENDRVIFKAFRENHINGESDAQEQKMDQYFHKCATDGYKIKRSS